MKKFAHKDRKHQIYSIGCVVLEIIKYYTLIVGVTFLGAFIASGLIYIMKGDNLTSSSLVKLYELITYYSSTEATEIIKLIGMGKAKVALLLYAFTYSLKYGIMYVLVSRFKEVFKSILKDTMFNVSNIEILYESVWLSLILAFEQPLLMALNIVTTHAFFDFESFDFSGILYLFVAVLLYMIFASGYKLEKKHEEIDKELEEYRAEISDLEIEKFKNRKEEKENAKVVEEDTEAPLKKKRRRRKKSTTKKSSDKQ